MDDRRFDPKHLHRLNDPDRLLDIPPDRIWGRLQPIAPEVVVDIGAGTGFFSVPFAGYLGSGTVFACDISDVMVAWMEDHVHPAHPKVVPLKMAEYAVPLADGSADLVYMINLHHELHAPERMLAEAFRLLKRAGKVFIVDWKKVAMAQGPPLHIRWLPEGVRDQLVDAGFSDVEIDEGLPKHFLIVAGKH